MRFKLYRTHGGAIVETTDGSFRPAAQDWDRLINQPALALEDLAPCDAPLEPDLLPPLGQQEVWAAGVTYIRSREARMEESREAAADLYARCYDAERPELFFKSMPQRVVGHGGQIRVRADATWSVPEPELTLVINGDAKIVGYTIGNDVSSRDIEGQNALYLPQAKIYEGSCAIGPCILMSDEALPTSTEIVLEILRDGPIEFRGKTSLAMIKRSLGDLVSYLFRELRFPHGCLLMTGTGIVPPSSFTLASGDVVRISIDGIGTLKNTVA